MTRFPVPIAPLGAFNGVVRIIVTWSFRLVRATGKAVPAILMVASLTGVTKTKTD